MYALIYTDFNWYDETEADERGDLWLVKSGDRRQVPNYAGVEPGLVSVSFLGTVASQEEAEALFGKATVGGEGRIIIWEREFSLNEVRRLLSSKGS